MESFELKLFIINTGYTLNDTRSENLINNFSKIPIHKGAINFLKLEVIVEN